MVYKCSTSFVTIFRNVTYFADRISVATNMTKVFANQSLYEDEKDNITVFIEEHLGQYFTFQAKSVSVSRMLPSCLFTIPSLHNKILQKLARFPLSRQKDVKNEKGSVFVFQLNFGFFLQIKKHISLLFQAHSRSIWRL